MGVFQAMFSVALQVSGMRGSSMTPVEAGPRNCGQSAALARIDVVAARTRNNRMIGLELYRVALVGIGRPEHALNKISDTETGWRDSIVYF